MQLRLGLNQSLELRQQLRQMLKLELTLELRLLLQQLLVLLQSLIEGRLDQAVFREVSHELIGKSHDDLNDLAHEFVRKKPVEDVQMFSMLISGIAGVTSGEAGEEWILLRDMIRNKRRERVFVPERFHEGVARGLRLIFRTPDWFGGKDGTPENLVILLSEVPQFDPDHREPIWVLSGGWAIELLTGEHLRHHHDIDAIALSGEPLYLDCDEVHTNDYFGILGCTRKYLLSNCVQRVSWTHGEQTFDVSVVHPEFLFCSKIFRAPRPQDWDDVCLLVRKFVSTFDLKLIAELARRNICGFDRPGALLKLLRTKDPEHIIFELNRSFR